MIQVKRVYDPPSTRDGKRFLVDGSFFPSSTAVNPALTIMANALRVSEHLKERLG